MAKNDIPKLASQVDWSFTNRPISGSYSGIAKALMEQNNGSLNSKVVSGKYVGTEFPQFNNIVYEFLVSIKNGQPMIGVNDLICLPCPDFCTGNIDFTDYDKINSIVKINLLNKSIFELIKIWDFHQIGSLFRKNYFPQTSLSDYYNLYKFYLKYRYERIHKFELEFVMFLLAYNLHHYEDARIRFDRLIKNYKSFNVILKAEELFSLEEIKNRIALKKVRRLKKHWNVTVIQCDNNFDGYLHSWQQQLIQVIQESNLSYDFNSKKDDFEEYKENRFNVNIVNSSLFNNYNELIHKIPTETEILIMVCHGDENNFLHFYSDNSFSGKPSLVSIKDFCTELKNIKLPEETIGMFFSCNSQNVFNYSSLNYNIVCNGLYNQTLMLPYCISFFSNLLFEQKISMEVFNTIHNKSKILSSIFSRMESIIEIKS